MVLVVVVVGIMKMKIPSLPGSPLQLTRVKHIINARLENRKTWIGQHVHTESSETGWGMKRLQE